MASSVEGVWRALRQFEMRPDIIVLIYCTDATRRYSAAGGFRTVPCFFQRGME